MTDEMLNLARDNAAKAGTTNAEFLHGHIESIPLPSESVDMIISNCVINLSANKAAVFAESFRVLRPGGRFGVSDILAEDHLNEADRAERGSHVGCIAGALSFTEYRDGLAMAGFTGIGITPTHEVIDGMHSAILRAVKPGPRTARTPSLDEQLNFSRPHSLATVCTDALQASTAFSVMPIPLPGAPSPPGTRRGSWAGSRRSARRRKMMNAVIAATSSAAIT